MALRGPVKPFLLISQGYLQGGFLAGRGLSFGYDPRSRTDSLAQRLKLAQVRTLSL